MSVPAPKKPTQVISRTGSAECSKRARAQPNRGNVKPGLNKRQKRQAEQEVKLSETVLHTRAVPATIVRRGSEITWDDWGNAARNEPLSRSISTISADSSQAEKATAELQRAYSRLGLSEPPGPVRDAARKGVQEVIQKERGGGQKLFVADCKLKTMRVELIRKNASASLKTATADLEQPLARSEKRALSKKWMRLDTAHDWQGSRLDAGGPQWLEQTVGRMQAAALGAYADHYDSFLRKSPDYMLTVMELIGKAVRGLDLDADDVFARDLTGQSGPLMAQLIAGEPLSAGPHPPAVLGDMLRRLFEAVRGQLFSFLDTEQMRELVVKGEVIGCKQSLAALPDVQRALIHKILDFLGTLEDADDCGLELGHLLFPVGDPLSPLPRQTLTCMIRQREALFDGQQAPSTDNLRKMLALNPPSFSLPPDLKPLVKGEQKS